MYIEIQDVDIAAVQGLPRAGAVCCSNTSNPSRRRLCAMFFRNVASSLTTNTHVIAPLLPNTDRRLPQAEYNVPFCGDCEGTVGIRDGSSQHPEHQNRPCRVLQHLRKDVRKKCEGHESSQRMGKPRQSHITVVPFGRCQVVAHLTVQSCRLWAAVSCHPTCRKVVSYTLITPGDEVLFRRVGITCLFRRISFRMTTTAGAGAITSERRSGPGIGRAPPGC